MIHQPREVKRAHEGMSFACVSLCLSHTLAVNAGDAGLNPNISSTYVQHISRSTEEIIYLCHKTTY